MFSLFNKNIEDTIGVNDLDKLIGTIDLIDIREPYEFTGGHIKTAKNTIPINMRRFRILFFCILFLRAFFAHSLCSCSVIISSSFV